MAHPHRDELCFQFLGMIPPVETELSLGVFSIHFPFALTLRN